MSYTLSKPFGDYSEYIQDMLCPADKKKMKNATYPFRNKGTAVNHYIATYLTRLISGLYKYENLPETVTARKHEEKLMIGGWSVVFKHPETGELYSMFGTLDGERDLENKPSLAIVSHPQLKKSLNLEILNTHFITKPSSITYDGTCVVCRNTSLYVPFWDIIFRYASLLVENDITQLMRVVHARRDAITTAPNEAGKNALETAEQKLEAGEMVIPLVSQFMDEVKNYPTQNSGSERLTDFIEYTQYLKASLFNELGLQSNYNMKREAIGSEEAEMNIDSLLTLVGDGLNCRKEDVELINKYFDTDISVDFGKLWKNVEKKQDPEQMKKETEDDTVEVKEDSVVEVESDPVEENQPEETTSEAVEKIITEAVEEVVEEITEESEVKEDGEKDTSGSDS